MKKLLASVGAILAALGLATSFATLALADNPADLDGSTRISTVNVTISEPAVGEHPDFSSWTIQSEPADAIQGGSITWLRFANPSTLKSTVLTSDDVFESGREYAFGLNAYYADGFYADSDTILTVNKQPAFYLSSVYDTYVSICSEPKIPYGSSPARTLVSEVDVTVTEPVVGQSPDLATPGCTSDPTDAVTDLQTTWYRVTDYDAGATEAMTPGDTFQAGETYLAVVAAGVDESAYFCEAGSTACTVNGQPADPKFSDVGDSLLNIGYVWKLPDPEPNARANIEMADFSVTAPKAGEHPDSSTPSYESMPADAFEGVKVYWYRPDHLGGGGQKWRIMNANDVFVPGETYFVAIMAPFDTNKFRSDMTIPVLKVNGQPADEELSEINDWYLGIAYVWYLPAEGGDEPVAPVPGGEDSPNAGGTLPATGDASLQAAALLAPLAIAAAATLLARRRMIGR